MGKRNQTVLGHMYIEEEKLDIHEIKLENGKVSFHASCLAVGYHTGDLVGMIITDNDNLLVWQDEEHITLCPSGINIGDTLEMDFELDPRGTGKVERWVLVK